MEPEFAERSRRIGTRLRGERQRRGWSLSDLSARTQGALSKSRISNYEQGLRRMGLEAAEQLACALETVTAAWLLALDEDGPFSDQALAVIHGFRTLGSQDRARLLEIAQVQPAKPHPGSGTA